MLLDRYFGRLFIHYYLLMHGMLTIIYSLIEFFEKTTRTRSGSLVPMLQFIGLSAVPTFFNTLYIATFLATILVIKDIEQHHELAAMQVLAIPLRSFIRPIIYCSVFLSIFCLLGNETIGFWCAGRARIINETYLKKMALSPRLCGWHQISDHQFIFVGNYNAHADEGKNFYVIDVTKDGALKSMHSFAYWNKTCGNEGMQYDFEMHQRKSLPQAIPIDQWISAPLRQIGEMGLTTLMTGRSGTSVALQLQAIKNICTYINVAVYPLVCIVFFCSMWSLGATSWGWAAIPYALGKLLEPITELAAQKAGLPYIFFSFYIFIIMILCIAILYQYSRAKRLLTSSPRP